MNLFRNRKFTFAAMALTMGATVGGLQACDGDGPLSGLAEQCGLVCPVEGVAEGNASISGVASVDAFFGAVLSVRDASANLKGSVRAEIDGMAASLEIDTSAMGLDEAAAAVQAGIQAKLDLSVDGGLTIKFQPPKCEASIDVALQAAAECDVEVTPGSVTASCEGSCEIDASAMAECSGDATLKCQGTAPALSCEGTCSGTCQLEVAAACEGACNGECSGSCSACVGGNCETDAMTGAITNCAGSCDAMCGGSCELSAGGSCSGSCEGSCEYTPPSGSCEGGATVKCEASADASVECSGKCEGSVEPPEVSAECKATVDAKAKAEISCTPPSLDVEFQFAATLDAQGQAEFKAWLSGFKLRFAGLLAARAKLEFVGEASIDAAASGVAAVEGAISATLGGDANLKAVIGLGCATDQLSVVGTVLGGVTADIQGSTSAILMVGTSVGGANWEQPTRFDVFEGTPVR